jgi:chemotaxis protein MotA
MQAISTAVLSTLYGALLAHLLCFPLATAITRRGARNESAREALAEWFIDQIAKAATLAQVRRAQLRGVA